MYSTIASMVSSVYPKRRRARGTVWLTICIDPPPTSFLNLTREKSGSMPVVSQSIMKPMVPVGASTEAWALRQPSFSPIRLPSVHTRVAVSYTHLRAHETRHDLVCRLLLEKK